MSTGRILVPLGDPPPVWRYVSLPLQAATLCTLALACVAIAWLAGEIVAPVPVHWNVRGEVDRWLRPDELWKLAVPTLVLTATPWLAAWGVSRERLVLPTREPERYAELQRARRAAIVRTVEITTLAISVSLTASFVLLTASALPGRQELRTLGLVAALCGAPLTTLVVLVALQRLVRLQRALREIAGTDALGTHASGWRWGGAVYYAPDDPAVWVPKRVGLGSTLNFARPGSWLLLAAIIFAPLALIWLIR